ncbi:MULTISPECIES: Crp/Fnr family transcriptional regulator [unclassified Streptomyces]|uniref:Crp/Fnr family transcriptional regulator n=1 Tax=unclassified Streptomyces TaxID=2593676 RepID=UPI0035D81D6B
MGEDRYLSVPSFRTPSSSEGWLELTRHRSQTYLAGRFLLRQGDAGTHVLALTRGLVKVVRTDRDGRQRLLAFRGPGEILGEMALQGRGVRMADVQAMSTCEASVIPAEHFQRFVRENRLAYSIAEMAISRLREQTEAHDGAVCERLAAALIRLVDASGGECCFSLTREELAQHVAAGRRAVSKALEELGPELVRVGKSRIEVISVEGLRAEVAGHNGR